MTTHIDIFTGETIRFSKSREHKGKNIIAAPSEYCVIDIETTGLSPDWDDIIEVSAKKFRDGLFVEDFSLLVKPEGFCTGEKFLDDFIAELTGITDEMLSTADNADIVLRKFYDFIGGSILVGHNVNFDINFLYDNLERLLNIYLSNDFVDTMRISRHLYPNEQHHRLSDLCERFSISYDGAHRALRDCEITNQCFTILIREALNQFESIDKFNKYIVYKRHGHLTKASDILSNNTNFDVSHPLYGKVCVFTGVLEKMPRREAMQKVADFGGINGDNVTKQTNYLILGNNDYCKSIKDGKSSKHKKAEKLKSNGQDIEIIPENVFYELIDE